MGLNQNPIHRELQPQQQGRSPPAALSPLFVAVWCFRPSSPGSRVTMPHLFYSLLCHTTKPYLFGFGFAVRVLAPPPKLPAAGAPKPPAPKAGKGLLACWNGMARSRQSPRVFFSFSPSAPFTRPAEPRKGRREGREGEREKRECREKRKKEEVKGGKREREERAKRK